MAGTIGPVPPGQPDAGRLAVPGGVPEAPSEPLPLLPVQGSDPALLDWLRSLLQQARTAAYACRSAAEQVCDDALARVLREESAARDAQSRVLVAIVSSLGGAPCELNRIVRRAVRERLAGAVPGGDGEVLAALRRQLARLDEVWRAAAPVPVPPRVARLLEELAAAAARHGAGLDARLRAAGGGGRPLHG
ncbi:MAG: hypothetical protein IRZ00_00440 [Gemmatimonadetes bacterium]|nr:hypothetical protein [Gemmatimonadota bacterium]